MRKPRVSIGMPVYNGERFIREALDSILAQSFTDFELIISDNASTDRTEEICRAYAAHDARIRYFRNENNLGAAANFNRTFELSTGEYFKWAAHDDVLARTYLLRCVETLDQASSSVVFCFPLMILIDEEGKVMKRCGFVSKRAVCRGRDGLRELRFSEVVRLTGARIVHVFWGLARTSALRKTRLLGTYAAADLVLAEELSLVGEFLQIPEHLFYQRLHGQQKLRARRSRKEEGMWWDTTDNSPSAFPPLVIVLLQFIRGINRCDLRWPTKFVRYRQLSGFLSQQLRQWLLSGIRATWSSVTLWAAAASNYTHLPLRLWAVGRLIRRSYGWRAGVAIRAAWKMSEDELLYRTALALVQRSSWSSPKVVAEWLEAPSQNQRFATAAAIAARLNGSRECALAHPLTKGGRRAYAVLLERRVRVEPSVRVLRVMVSTLSRQDLPDGSVAITHVLQARRDLDAATIRALLGCAETQLGDCQGVMRMA